MEILNSTTALIGACAALVGGLVALLSALQALRGEAKVSKAKGRRLIGFAAAFFIVSVSLAASWNLGRRAETAARERTVGSAESLNAKLARETMEAFNGKAYAAALAKARECVDEFEGGADRQQRALAEAKAPEPPLEKFTEAQKRDILARGVLNDTAACFFFAGRSAEKLTRLEEAKEAYQKAGKYTYARVWDPKGWFWSPAAAAQDRLLKLEK